MDTFSNEIDYENGCGDRRRFYAAWHAGLGIVCFSFYSCERPDELVFAEDFDLQTGIRMRDELSRVITAATTCTSAGGPAAETYPHAVGGAEGDAR